MSVRLHTDDELIQLLNEGSEAAFNEIYNRYWSGVFLVARNRLKNDSEAEEIVQNIFCNLWKKRKSFHLHTSFHSYFAVAVKYEIINQVVKKRRETAFVEHFSKVTPNTDNSTVQTLNFNELQRELENSICSLPERCQLVFRLKFEDDYSQKQIAEELLISEKTVEAHLSKARKHIHNSLGVSLPYALFYFLHELLSNNF